MRIDPMMTIRYLSSARALIVAIVAVLGAGFFAGAAAQDASNRDAARAAVPAPAAALTTDASTPPAATKLEPRAIELLKAASQQLVAAKAMTFTAVVSYESPSVFGPALVYTTRSEVTMQRPNRLRVITPGDGPATEFYYDGKTMTAFAPAENLVATSVAPATIDATLASAYDTAAIYFPFTDLIVADPYKDLAEGLKVAFYIGQSNVVAGTTTDMVAFANDNVFAQIWIGADDKLPRKLRAVYLNDPQMLRHDMDLSNWKLDPKLAADAFSAAKAATAVHIAFARPDAKPPGAVPQGSQIQPPMTAPTAPKPTKAP
jgi:hypothetical protein